MHSDISTQYLGVGGELFKLRFYKEHPTLDRMFSYAVAIPIPLQPTKSGQHFQQY